MLELINATLLLVLGIGAIKCVFMALYLITPQGKYMWSKIAGVEQERRQRNRVIHDWLDGKNET